MSRLALSSHIYCFCFSREQYLQFVCLRPKTCEVATRVSGRKWVQSTELDIVNGSFCNLCGLAVGLALYIYATQCCRAPTRAKQLSTVAILPYRFLSCWCLETFFAKYQPCSLLSLYIFFCLIRSLVEPTQRFIVCSPLPFAVTVVVPFFLGMTAFYRNFWQMHDEQRKVDLRLKLQIV